jgi:glycerophosphoryl diester phosphodiesterase
MASLLKAVEIGAGGSECDVHATCDGAIVVMHDGKVDRTTNGKGEIAKMSLLEIKRLDAGRWKDPRYAGEPVPMLDDFLAALKNTPCKPVIEIKGDNIADKVVAAVRAHKMLDHAYVISFNKDSVKAVRKLEPALPCALLLGANKETKTWDADKIVEWVASQAQECGTTFVDLDRALLTAEIVTKLRAKKLTVWTWTVDDAATMDNLLAWGVESITTNCPDVLLSRIQAASQQSN